MSAPPLAEARLVLTMTAPSAYGCQGLSRAATAGRRSATAQPVKTSTPMLNAMICTVKASRPGQCALNVSEPATASRTIRTVQFAARSMLPLSLAASRRELTCDGRTVVTARP